MKDRLCLVFCDYFQQEIEWIFKQQPCKDVKLNFYKSDCDHIPSSSSLFETLVKQSVTDSIIIFAGYCLNRLVKELPSSQLQIEHLEHCLELLIPEKQFQELLNQGSHIVTSGMIARWDEVSETWGFNDAERLAFFQESTTKLVLISHSQLPSNKAMMEKIAAQLNLPWESVDISLDHLESKVFKVVNQWRGKVIIDKKRQLADYAMVNDLMANIAALREEKQVITQVLELFHMFCEPNSSCFLGFEDNKIHELKVTVPILDKEKETQKLSKIKDSYVLDKANNGFQLLIKRNDEKMGVFSVYRVAFPQYLNHYLNLARNIAPVIALSIGNARIYQKQQQAEINIRQLNSQLKNQLETVNHLNKELESFTYSVSHDLRNPLVTIDSFLNILQRDYSFKLDKRGIDIIQRVIRNSERMSELIEDLLRLSRLTRVELHKETVDLSKIATEIAQDLQQTHPNRNVEFIIAKDLQVQGDTSLLRVVLENLINNAWKYSQYKEHAKIEFARFQHENEQGFKLQDNGAGFDMERADELFLPFRRLHSEDEFKGSGIGLATVQRIIARHGGKIWATSEINKGTCFYFTLN